MGIETTQSQRLSGAQILSDETDFIVTGPDGVRRLSTVAFVQQLPNIDASNIRSTWAVLEAEVLASPPDEGTGYQIIDADTGTHTDPVVGGTVSNAGIYAYRAAGTVGLERIADTQVKSVGDQADRAEVAETGAESAKTDAQAAAADAAADATEVAGIVESRASFRSRFPDDVRLFRWIDKSGREVAYTDLAGQFHTKLSEVNFPGWTLKDRQRLDSSNRIAILSSNFRLLGYIDPEQSTEVLQSQLNDMAGSRADAATRLDQSLDEYGNPKRYYFGEHYLRRFRYLRRKLLYGESSTIAICAFGDSFTHAYSRYSGPLAEMLIAELGDAGGGWTGYAAAGGVFINGNVRPSSYTLLIGGSGWDSSVYVSSVGPDIGQLTSGTAGDKITRTGPDAATLDNVALFWIGTADGVVRYRWNAGAWTSLNVQGTVGNLYSAALSTDQPASSAWTLEIEVVSGTVTLCGDVTTGTGDGVIFHKLGSTGSQASHWAAVDATKWKSGITALAPDLVTIMLATNDQGVGRTSAQFKADLTSIVTRSREAMPLVDVLILMPAENQRDTNIFPMTSYAVVAREVAVEQKCAFGDMQYLFGDDPADYAFDGPLPLNNSDGVHPEPETGGRVIVDGAHRILTTV